MSSLARALALGSTARRQRADRLAFVGTARVGSVPASGQHAVRTFSSLGRGSVLKGATTASKAIPEWSTPPPTVQAALRTETAFPAVTRPPSVHGGGFEEAGRIVLTLREALTAQARPERRTGSVGRWRRIGGGSRAAHALSRSRGLGWRGRRGSNSRRLLRRRASCWQAVSCGGRGGCLFSLHHVGSRNRQRPSDTNVGGR